MRITADQQAIVLATVAENFGSDAQVRLFGSRVDDSKRGGDIDLLITTRERDVSAIMRAEIALITKLQMKLGEQKIEVLLDYPTLKERPPIFQRAEQTGLLLCAAQPLPFDCKMRGASANAMPTTCSEPWGSCGQRSRCRASGSGAHHFGQDGARAHPGDISKLYCLFRHI